MRSPPFANYLIPSHDTAITCCAILGGSNSHKKRRADPRLVQQVYSILAGSFAVRRFSTFCAALVGGYTFLQWPLRLLCDYAYVLSKGTKVPSKRLRNASHVVSRFLAAVISAWFSLEVFKYKAIGKVEQKNPNQSAQDQQRYVANGTGLTSQNAESLDSKISKAAPPLLAGKTLDLTLLAVTRALDSLVVALYRRSYPSFASTALVSSTFGAISQYADTFIFALSSGAVVRLQTRAIPP